MSEPVVACVLGMHRSGTSLLMGLLRLLGVRAGPGDRLLEGRPDNPRGFFEHQGIVALNERLLERRGGTWDRPPALPAGWELDPDLDDLAAEARALVARDFGGLPRWGFKDPRTCLTLPFWRRAVPGLRPILCLRHPGSVARSLSRRNGFEKEQGLWLWLVYVRASLAGTDPAERLLVRHDELLANAEGALSRVASFLGVEPELGPSELRRAIDGFVDEELVHHEAEDGDLPSPVLAVWRALAADGEPDPEEALRRIELALERSSGESRKAEWERQAARRWERRIDAVASQLVEAVPGGSRVLVVNEHHWPAKRHEEVGQALPFPHREGRPWGAPADDAAALRELARERSAGATHLAVAWPSFWWLTYYPGLAGHLRAHARRVHQSDDLVVFDLASRPSAPARRAPLDVVLVAGCARSGTSVLGELLGSHPAVRYAFEAHHVWELGLRDEPDHHRLTASDLREEHGQRIRDALEDLRGEAPTLVEKNPRHALRIPFLRAVLPESRIVHIVRDGRDVACSMVPGCGGGEWSHLKPPSWRRLMTEHRGAVRCAHAWREVMEIALDDLRAVPHHQVRYEDLLAEPVGTARRLFDFLDLPEAPEALAFCGRISDETRGSYHAGRQDRWYRPTHERRVGRWRENLSAEDREEISGLLRPLLERLGYE